MFDVDISFKLNGRKVNPNNMKDELEKAIFKDITGQIKKKLQSVSCKEHRGKPKVTVKGQSMKNLTFEVSGCCQMLIDEATAKLK